MAKVIMVVPCYNEALRLKQDEFCQFTLPGHSLQFLFVNDGSTDDTLRVLMGMASQVPEKISVLDLVKNGGKAEAVRQGFAEAFTRDPEFVGFWDADLATPLYEIPRFVEIAASRPEIDMVFGSRVKLLGRTIERNVMRHYFGRVFATAVSATLQVPIYDSQCGAKLFRNTPLIQSCFQEPFLSRWIFDVELVARYRQRKHALKEQARGGIYELPLTEWKDIKGSKVKPGDGIRAFKELMAIRKAYTN